MRTKLLAIQTELKAPKNQFNKFGNYNYRSCEDILEAVKPLLKKYNCTLVLHDSIEDIGNKNYIVSTATLLDCDSEKELSSKAYAREADIQKGMSESQISGSTSSYARKYALNGLFLIDDTKDDDFNNKGDKPEQKQEKPKGVISKALPAIKSAADLKALQTLESFIDKNAWSEEELKELDLAISAKKGDFK